jgi:hypothetical protein
MLGAFAKLFKTPITFLMSVRLSASISAVPTGRIAVNFDILGFNEHLSIQSKFG